MGFQDLGRFGHPRNPAIRTTGLLTFALAGLSPAEHTSVYWSQPSDMLAVRIGQLTAEVFHLLDLQPCWLLRTIIPWEIGYRLKTTAGSIRTTLNMALTAATTHIPMVNTKRPQTRLNVMAMGKLSRRR